MRAFHARAIWAMEEAAAEAGLVMAMVRTNEEFRRELQYTEVLSNQAAATSAQCH